MFAQRIDPQLVLRQRIVDAGPFYGGVENLFVPEKPLDMSIEEENIVDSFDSRFFLGFLSRPEFFAGPPLLFTIPLR